MQNKFPSGFLWGAATSAHQVEGNTDNDWTEWEINNSERLARAASAKQWPDYVAQGYPNPFDSENYISGEASGHYARYAEDIELAKSLCHNAHRFSIEWSRVEPEEGRFVESEIIHYKNIIRALRKQGMEPFVTLWHFTLPLWVRNRGGLAWPEFPKYFARYAARMTQELDGVKFWMTLNEPTTVIGAGYLSGQWPPQKKNIFAAIRALKNCVRAHKLAHEAIKAANPETRVGIGHLMLCVEPKRRFSPAAIFAIIVDFFANKYFLFLLKNKFDFLGFQYYFHNRIRFPYIIDNENRRVSDMGWELYPEGIFRLLLSLKEYGKPIYVTENGLADARDLERGWYIRESLAAILKAIDAGADVCGYFHWSLLDNFEWDKGFWPRFGLIEVNYKTMERKIRPSALAYAEIIKKNSL